MKGALAVGFTLLAVAALVHGVLVVAHVSEPAAITVSGLTARRLWASVVAMLALAGAVVGALAFLKPAGRLRALSGRRAAMLASVAGAIAAVNGVLVLAVAEGGPGSGNGVVGGAGAVVTGFIALALGGAALARYRRI